MEKVIERLAALPDPTETVDTADSTAADNKADVSTPQTLALAASVSAETPQTGEATAATAVEAPASMATQAGSAAATAGAAASQSAMPATAATQDGDLQEMRMDAQEASSSHHHTDSTTTSAATSTGAPQRASPGPVATAPAMPAETSAAALQGSTATPPPHDTSSHTQTHTLGTFTEHIASSSTQGTQSSGAIGSIGSTVVANQEPQIDDKSDAQAGHTSGHTHKGKHIAGKSGVSVSARAGRDKKEKGPGRNQACPCGSKKKYKACCGTGAEVRRRAGGVQAGIGTGGAEEGGGKGADVEGEILGRAAQLAAITI